MKPKFSLKPDGRTIYRVYEIEPRCQTIRLDTPPENVRRTYSETYTLDLALHTLHKEEYFYLSMPYVIFIERCRPMNLNPLNYIRSFYPLFSYVPIKDEKMFNQLLSKSELFTPPFPNIIETGVCMGTESDFSLEDFWNTAFTSEATNFISPYFCQLSKSNTSIVKATRTVFHHWAYQTTKDKDFGMKHKWLPATFDKLDWLVGPNYKIINDYSALNWPVWSEHNVKDNRFWIIPSNQKRTK